MAVSPLAAGIVGVTFSQVRELIARRWVVVAVVVLALVALGQKSESTPEPLLASSAQMALGATSEFRLWFPVVAGCFVAGSTPGMTAMSKTVPVWSGATAKVQLAPSVDFKPLTHDVVTCGAADH